MRLLPFVLALGIVLGVSAVPGTGHANPALGPQQVQQARSHYVEGQAALKAGRYDKAVEEFISAYDITKDPKLFFHVARAYELNGQKVEALIYYRRYLREGGLSEQGRKEIELKVETLTRETAAGDQAPAQPTPAPAPAEPNDPTAEPAPPGVPPAAVGAVESRPLAAPPPGRWARTTGWVFLSVGVVAAATGGVLALAAESREEDLTRLVNDRDEDGLPNEYGGQILTDYEDKRDQGENLDKVSTYAFIGAGALAGAAAVFFIVDLVSGDPSPKRTATVTPVVGNGTMGVGASWSF